MGRPPDRSKHPPRVNAGATAGETALITFFVLMAELVKGLQVPKTKKNCELCTVIFLAENREIRRGNGRFCSRLCARRNNQINATKAIKTDHGWRENKRLNRKRDRIKDSAREKVYKALKVGKLTRMTCQNCHSDKTEAHHPDYSKPLDVIWLCKQCHTKEHKCA